MNFDELFWHDAILMSIHIDRENPGKKDIIQLTVQWPTEKISIIEFYDCYALNAQMNFGVVSCESILEAQCILESHEINDIREKWLKMQIKLDDLKCYRIITNSTNSHIDIYAMKFEVIEK